MRSRARSNARELVSLSCGGGSCPGVYRTDDGAYLIQGYRTSRLGRLFHRETVVEVPAELMRLIVANDETRRELAS